MWSACACVLTSATRRSPISSTIWRSRSACGCVWCGGRGRHHVCVGWWKQGQGRRSGRPGGGTRAREHLRDAQPPRAGARLLQHRVDYHRLARFRVAEDVCVLCVLHVVRLCCARRRGGAVPWCARAQGGLARSGGAHARTRARARAQVYVELPPSSKSWRNSRRGPPPGPVGACACAGRRGTVQARPGGVPAHARRARASSRKPLPERLGPPASACSTTHTRQRGARTGRARTIGASPPSREITEREGWARK